MMNYIMHTLISNLPAVLFHSRDAPKPKKAPVMYISRLFCLFEI